MVIFHKPVAGLTEGTLARFTARARRAAGLPSPINVLVTTNSEMKSLNRRFRGQDKPTDVLSFPAVSDCKDGFAGDIAISAEIAAQNARALGHAPAVEVKILTLHGILHLCGYDHEHDRGQMARREHKLRRELNLPVGLIERADTSAAATDHTPQRKKRRA